MKDTIPNMDDILRNEIVKLNREQLSTLFWQVYGSMRIDHYDAITEAIESAMFDVRRVKDRR